MKKRSRIWLGRVRPAARNVAAMFSLLAGIGLSRAADESASAKTHTLFMGADLAVVREDKMHRVQDVTGTSFTIEADGKAVQVPQGRKLSLRVKERLKVADHSVSMGKLVVERAYTPENDPFSEFVSNASAAAGQAAVQDLAWAEVQAAERTLEGARKGAVGPGAGQATDAIVKAEEALRQANQKNAMEAQAMYSSQFDPGYHANRMKQEEAEENFDAIRVTMEFTPEENLPRPYYVVIAQFRERDSKPNTARKWIYTRSLDALEAGVTRKIILLEGGFPHGYVLEDYSAHLYDRGEELATNLSRKRVELTTSEAYDYQAIEYVSANKGKTLPAALIATSISGPLRSQLRALVDSGVYVRVTKDGRVSGGFHDAAGTRPLPDAEAQAALKTLRFTPALQDGRPVEQTALLKWSGSSS